MKANEEAKRLRYPFVRKTRPDDETCHKNDCAHWSTNRPRYNQERADWGHPPVGVCKLRVAK